MTAENRSVLYEHHVAYLTTRAVDLAVIDERRYFSAPTKASLQNMGFSRGTPAPAMVIPLWNVVGECEGNQVRPDAPRSSGDRKLKFEVPPKFQPRLDVHPRALAALADPTIPVWITEGIPKGDALVSAGMCAVALLGVWNWTGVALSDFQYLRPKGRQIYIAFDSDVMLKKEVHTALARLAELLTSRGGDVAFVYLPDGTEGRKQGVDDFLAAGGTIAELLERHTTTELRTFAWEDKEQPPPADTFDDVPDEQGWRVLDDVAGYLERFVVFPSAPARDVATLWCAHTWVFSIFEMTPRLAILSGDKRSGKSRLLNLVGTLCRNARRTSNMSAAYLFRRVELDQPTLLVDEIDTIFGPKAGNNHEDLRGLINDGFERGGSVGRMIGEGAAMKPHDFPVFTPVALAGIGRLPDTIMDRSVVVSMKRRLLGEVVEPFRSRRVRPEHEALHRRLAAWAHRAEADLAEADPKIPEGVDDRAADLWEVLIAVADVAGGHWPERARDACAHFTDVRAVDDDSWRVALIAEIIDIFDEDAVDSMTSKELGERLVGRGAWEGTLTAQRLSVILRPFGIRSTKERRGTKTWRGYYRADFDDAQARYINSPPPPEDRHNRHNRHTAGSGDQDRGDCGDCGASTEGGEDSDVRGDESPSPTTSSTRLLGCKRCGDPDGTVGKHPSGEFRCDKCWSMEAVDEPF